LPTSHKNIASSEPSIDHPTARRAQSSSYLAFAIGGALMIGGCSTGNVGGPLPPPVAANYVPPVQPPMPTGQAPSGGRLVTASWYGSELAGHRTSNGERFDPNRMTAASKTLPLGSVVRVTNPSNGKSVDVRITDRGPYVGGRSIDLSRGAARKIGITKKGVARVKISSVHSAADASPAPLMH
jgi:Lytic transglycolase